MITNIRSSLDDFRTGSFVAGMNIVLADTAEDADETESTNGLGKTTLIRITQFCLGGDVARDKVLSHPDLNGVSFGMTFVWGGLEIEVDRKTNEDTVLVSEPFLSGLDLETIEREGEFLRVSLSSWKQALSARLAPDAKTQSGEFSPSFRELMLYLARLGKAAFNDPLLAFQGQPGASKRLIVSFLLGLNWSRQRQLQQEEGRRTQINAAIKALRDAQESTDEQSIGDLEAERVVLEGQIERKRTEVSQFNVRDDYRSLEARLNTIDRDLHDNVNENHSDQRLLEYYRRSAKEVPEAPEQEPLSILKDAGAVFKEETLRSLDEIAEFHQQIYRNRSDFLKTEIDRLREQIAFRNARIDQLSQEKKELLSVLQSSGALETLIDLQRGLTDLEANSQALKARIEERKRFDRRKDEVSAEIIDIRKLLKRDLDDRREIVDEAVSLFAEYTRALYGVPGKLGIDVGNSGYSFSFSIDREGSDGVDQMVVFCFDLMVATLRARRRQPFAVLIHDSSVFADVDPRQYGLALQLAASTSKAEGFQYICCLNAGALPSAHLGDLKLDEYVRLRLTDDGDEGRLLGRRLPPRER